jgi:hypothetical protein
MKRRSELRDGSSVAVVAAVRDEKRAGEPVAEEVLTSFLFHHLPALCKV